MFCPKCGNEITKDTKFCPKCGEQLAKEAVTAKDQENTTSQKADAGKIILISVISLVVLLIVILAVNKIKGRSGSETASGEITQDKGLFTSKKSKGYSSYEDAIDALFTAAYNKDVEGVINCFPEEMEAYAKKLYNAYRTASETGWSGDLLNYTTGKFFGFEKLNMDNEYSYEIVEATELEQTNQGEKPSVFTNEELQAEFGLTYDEAYIVNVKSIGKYYTEQFGESGYMTNGAGGYFEVAKIGGKWYVLKVDDAFRSDWYE